MSDQGLRQLERRWRASGDPADEAAWLLGRLRAGELPAERLELAALLGHEPAARAAQEADRPLPPLLFDLRRRERVPDTRWLIGALWERSREAVVRFGAAIGRNRLGGGGGPDSRPALLAALDAAEAWCRCPCEEHRAPAARAGQAVWAAISGQAWRAEGPELLGAAFAAAVTAEATGPDEARFLRHLLAHEAPGDLERASREVVVWALGLGDPLADRAPRAAPAQA